MRAMLANPILARELKERMRSRRAPFVITAYLLVLAFIVYVTERSVTNTADFGDVFSSAVAGRTVFHYLLAGLLSLVLFMVPGYAAGAITLERERQTFQLVQVTLLRPWEIVLGKLSAAFAYLMFLVIATLPLVSISFVLGGVTPWDVIRGYAMVLFVGLWLALICIAISARSRRTMGATVLCYALVLTLTAGTGIVYGLAKLWHVQRERAASERGEVFLRPPEPTYTLVLNPYFGVASAIKGKDRGGYGTPFGAMFSFLTVTDDRTPGGGDQFFGDFPGPDGRPIDVPGDGRRVVPFWFWTVFWYIALGAGAFAIAVHAVHSPTGRLRLPKRIRGAAAEAG